MRSASGLIHSHPLNLVSMFLRSNGIDVKKAPEPADSLIKSLVSGSRSQLYHLLPQKMKVLASELVFKYSNRPHVHHDINHHPAKGLERGAVTFSIDFELAWGWAYAKGMTQEEAVSIGLRERRHVPIILDRMDEYEIPATWATVGHLFLNNCERDEHERAHNHLAHLPHFENNYWRFASGDWFQVDPCSDYHRDPAWYAPDLIAEILEAKVRHEIGSHSFSHGGFGCYCPPEVAEGEIDACIEAMKPFGLRPKTWVFPGNDVGNFKALAKRGFRNVRSFPVDRAEISLPLKRPDGMWDIPDSTPIDLEGNGWDFKERLERLKKFVDKAAETNLCAHIWFHPSLPLDQMNGLLFPLLEYCSQQRAKGLIDVLTIDQLVDATEAALRLEGKA